MCMLEQLPTAPQDPTRDYSHGRYYIYIYIICGAWGFMYACRPKLMFDSSGNPIAIINGVSPIYPCDSCKGFGDAPTDGGCCWCKVKQGEDWTYTLMQPLG